MVRKNEMQEREGSILLDTAIQRTTEDWVKCRGSCATARGFRRLQDEKSRDNKDSNEPAASEGGEHQPA